MTKIKEVVDNYEISVKELQDALKSYNELDVSVFSKLNHLEDVQAILRVKPNSEGDKFLSETKIKKATNDTKWLVNNIDNLKKVEETIGNSNNISEKPTVSSLKIKKS
jgi:hypothetical protein